jgi:hypothetical protein
MHVPKGRRQQVDQLAPVGTQPAKKQCMNTISKPAAINFSPAEAETLKAAQRASDEKRWQLLELHESARVQQGTEQVRRVQGAAGRVGQGCKRAANQLLGSATAGAVSTWHAGWLKGKQCAHESVAYGTGVPLTCLDVTVETVCVAVKNQLHRHWAHECYC